MTLTDTDRQAQIQLTNIAIALQQHLEDTETENELLKQSIRNHKEQYELDQKGAELKLKSVLQENHLICYRQERMESELYEKEEELDRLRKDTQHWRRLYEDLAKSSTMEREEFDKDRLSWYQRESKMSDQLLLLQQQHKDQHYNRLPRRKNGLLSAHSTPHIPSLVDHSEEIGNDKHTTVASSFTPQDNQMGGTQPASSSPMEPLNLADRQTISTQETVIAGLKLELEHQTQKLHLESDKASLKMNDLIAQINNIKQLNQSLMEENESYQILLHEKAICGEFISDPKVQFDKDMDYFGSNAPRSSGLNLADELTIASNQNTHHMLSKKEEMMAEIKTLQDANRALQLYMNKILLRIVENKHLETILSIDEPNKPAAATIIKPTPLQTASSQSMLPPLDSSQKSSFDSFIMDENIPFSATATSATSSDDGRDDSDSGADSGGDSWTQVFRRMSSGFSGWSKVNDTVYEKPSVEVDHSLRSLYLLNK